MKLKKKLTTVEVNKRVEAIKAIAYDDEGAHAMEDTLWQEVLEAIANGLCDHPGDLADAVLKTTSIKFARWYA